MDTIMEMMSIKTNAQRKTPRKYIKGSDILNIFEESKEKNKNGLISQELFDETRCFIEYLLGSKLNDNSIENLKNTEIEGQNLLDIAQEFCEYNDEDTVTYFVNFISPLLQLPEETVRRLLTTI